MNPPFILSFHKLLKIIPESEKKSENKDSLLENENWKP